MHARALTLFFIQPPQILKKAPQAAMMSFATFMWLDKNGGREVGA